MEDRNILVVVLITVALAIVNSLGTLAIKFIGDDVKAWLPVIVTRIFERALRLLDFRDREFFRQQWQSRLDETPGDLSKLIVVAICYREAMRRVRDQNDIPLRFRRYGVAASILLAVAIAIPNRTSSDGTQSATKLVAYVPLSGKVMTVKGISDAVHHADNPSNTPLGPALGTLGAGEAFLRAPSVAGLLHTSDRGESMTFNTIVGF